MNSTLLGVWKSEEVVLLVFQLLWKKQALFSHPRVKPPTTYIASPRPEHKINNNFLSLLNEKICTSHHAHTKPITVAKPD